MNLNARLATRRLIADLIAGKSFGALSRDTNRRIETRRHNLRTYATDYHRNADKLTFHAAAQKESGESWQMAWHGAQQQRSNAQDAERMGRYFATLYPA